MQIRRFLGHRHGTTSGGEDVGDHEHHPVNSVGGTVTYKDAVVTNPADKPPVDETNGGPDGDTSQAADEAAGPCASG